jgi:WD40 repeat protein
MLRNVESHDRMATATDVSLPELPFEILVEHVTPFLERSSVANLSWTNKKIQQFIQENWSRQRWPKTFRKSWPPFDPCCMAFSPNGDTVSCGAKGDGKILILNRDNGRCTFYKAQSSINISSLAFTPDGSRLVSGSEDGSICLWDPEDPRYFRELVAASCSSSSDENGVTCIAVSPDGQTIAAGVGWYGEIRLLSMADGSFIRSWDPPNRYGLDHGFLDPGQCWDSLVFSSNGKVLASSGTTSFLSIWNLAEDYNRNSFLVGPGRWDTSRFVKFMPDGYLVSVDDKVIRFREGTICSSNDPVDEEAIVKCIDMTAYLSDDSRLQSFTLSSDGVFAATGHSSNHVHLWDIEKGNHVTSCSGSFAAFVPGQRAFATMTFDFRLELQLRTF